jgi:hypothetical protein
VITSLFNIKRELLLHSFCRFVFRKALIMLLTTLVLSLSGPGDAPAADLHPFTSDGCSLFPDGTIKDRTKWCDCCLSHDIAYWQGGTEEERKKTDGILRDCVFERTGDKPLAETMYLGVRAGGHPAFPAWYRWGYGWSYGRGYMPLSDAEKQRVLERFGEYAQQHPTGYCGEHGVRGSGLLLNKRE